MSKHFSVFVSPRSLANAASFLQEQGAKLRSRNQLVSLCISYVEELANQKNLVVASSDSEGEEFLLREGLGGNAERSWAGKPVEENYKEMGKLAAALGKASKRSGEKWQPPPVTEQDVLDAAQHSAESGETLEEFHEFALAAFPGALESEALREKVSKLFEKI